ncbi:MAG: C1 family peptidase [Desulfobacteraceae bacterium]
MMKKAVSLLCCTSLVLLLITTVSVAAPRQMRVHARDVGKIMQLEQDTVAVIELDSQPSTGLGWRAGRDLNSGLKILGTEFEPSPSGLLGAWVKEKIYVVADGRGKADLRLEYRRAFESAALDDVTFSFTTQGRFTESFTLPAPSAQEPAAMVQDVSPPSGLTALPGSFNWCDHNGCTPVKNQGSCGSCCAFATAGPLESLIKINDGITADLSEQYLVSCNIDGWGCDGGFWAHDYHEWKMADGETEAGAVLESSFPYEARDAACNPPHPKAYRIDSWQYVCPDCTPTTAQLKQAIYAHGPLSVSVCVNDAFQSYSGGIFAGPGCSDLNHGVVLVGWDDDDGCWILRNSWSSAWGEGGYKRIKYGVSGIGTYAAYVAYGEAPNPDPQPEPENGEIINGQTISDLSAEQGQWLHFHITVPENASNLQVRITGGSGDADLYTQFGTQPTSSNYDCRPYRYGNNETCTHEPPLAGTWYVGLQAYTDFSGVALSASYQEGDPDTDPEPVPECVTTDNLTHINQGRAYRCGWWSACAVGSRDYLGRAVSTAVSSLQETSENYWERTDSCP